MTLNPIARQAVQATTRKADLLGLGLIILSAAVLGGSSLWNLEGHLWLQFLSAFVLLCLFLLPRPVPWRPSAVIIGACGGLTILAALLQLLPLADQLGLDARTYAAVRNGWAQLGSDGDVLTISLTPAESVSAAMAVIPPLGVFLVTATARWSLTVRPLCWGLVCLAGASALLGLLQIATRFDEALFLYPTTNAPTGLFSNANHQASFLLMALPIAVAVLVKLRREMVSFDSEQGLLVAAVALFLVLIFGILSAGSMAGYALLAIVAPASLLLAIPKRSRLTPYALPAFAAAAILGVGVVMASVVVLAIPISDIVPWSENSRLERLSTWETSADIFSQHAAFGTGFGSFRYVFPVYEPPSDVDGTYMNAAHNDYLQFAVELGGLGICLMLVALGVWAWLAQKIWRHRMDDENRLRRAATISTLVVLLHSLIDYPLRAPLYAVVAAACFGLMALPFPEFRKAAAPSASSDKRIAL